MIEWLLLPETKLAVVRGRLPQAWSGSALAYPFQPTKDARPALLLVPERAVARRAPRWPDVLSDWSDIYEEPLFPSPRLPVAGEVVSEGGVECLALHLDLGHPSGARGGVAWYDKGGVVELEQVGAASVAWRRGEALSRPSLSGAVSQLAALGRRTAGTARDAGLYERVETSRAVTAEAIVLRALLRLCGDDPPPIQEILQQVSARAGQPVPM